MSWTLYQEGKYGESEKLLRETLDLQKRVLGPDHVETLQSMSDLGWTLGEEGRYAEAEKMDRKHSTSAAASLAPNTRTRRHQ